MDNINDAKKAILTRQGANIFDVLNISPNSSKEDIMESALAFYEGGEPISLEDFNRVSNDLALLGVEWAPKPVVNLNVSTETVRKPIHFSIVKSIVSKRVYRKSVN